MIFQSSAASAMTQPGAPQPATRGRIAWEGARRALFRLFRRRRRLRPKLIIRLQIDDKTLVHCSAEEALALAAFFDGTCRNVFRVAGHHVMLDFLEVFE